MEHPAPVSVADVIRRAHELRILSMDCQESWRLFARILEAFERLPAVETLEHLEQLTGDAYLQPLVLAVARRATERFPEYGRAWFLLGVNQLMGDPRSSTAYRALERAWDLSPDARVDFAVCLSASYLAVKRWQDAERVCRQMLHWQPENADAHSNLSIALCRQFQSEAAVAAAREALRCEPEHVHAPSNLVLALVDCERFHEALETARAYLAARQGENRLRLPLAELELRLGQWREGWPDMDARFAVDPMLGGQLQARERQLGVPFWRGESLRGKVLGIWLEQGYGDAILLIRFLPSFAKSVRERGGRLVFGCFSPLVELFRPLIPQGVKLDIDHLRRTDYHLPLMSACGAFGITEGDVSGVPYLGPVAPGKRSGVHRPASDTRLQVALAWTGNPQQVRNDMRSLDEAALMQLLTQDGVLFHSVNPQVADEVSRLAASGFPIVDRSAELNSFADTARLFAELDLVVSTCTSTVHLAGALGVPTWLLLDRVGSYIWRCDRQRTSWYDSVRIIRQDRLGDWAPVIQRLRRQLDEQLQSKAGVPDRVTEPERLE